MIYNIGSGAEQLQLAVAGGDISRAESSYIIRNRASRRSSVHSRRRHSPHCSLPYKYPTICRFILSINYFYFKIRLKVNGCQSFIPARLHSETEPRPCGARWTAAAAADVSRTWNFIDVSPLIHHSIVPLKWTGTSAKYMASNERFIIEVQLRHQFPEKLFTLSMLLIAFLRNWRSITVIFARRKLLTIICFLLLDTYGF